MRAQTLKKRIVILCAVTVLMVLAGAVWIGLELYMRGPVLNEAVVVLPYIGSAVQGGSFVFDAGPYRDGTAVLGPNNMAFWVKDGTGYVVNEAAREAAPDLEQAPANIRFDHAFVEAAHAGE